MPVGECEIIDREPAPLDEEIPYRDHGGSLAGIIGSNKYSLFFGKIDADSLELPEISNLYEV
jgi:hypothetical protein